MYYHHQNLDERPGDQRNATGHIWRHGRAWLRFDTRTEFHWSWSLWTRFCGCSLSCGQEDGLTLFVAFPPFAFWFSLYLPFLSHWYGRHDWKELGLRIHSAALWVHLWADDSCWAPSKPFWHTHNRRFSWYPLDTIFGRMQHQEERVLDTTEILVAMPERGYRGTAVRKVETWRRPRWPWWPSAIRKVRTHVDMQEPIPFPGKGENAWDCGEDALHGQTSSADTIPKAIASITESVLTSRRRYGGPRWVPEASRPDRLTSAPA